MHSSDARAKNLFARLFTYAPRPLSDPKGGKPARQRNALEDFCTEALAWCLIRSRNFADRLFAADCFAAVKFEPETYDVETQLSFSGEEADEEDAVANTLRSRFDLVLNDAAPGGSMRAATARC